MRADTEKERRMFSPDQPTRVDNRAESENSAATGSTSFHSVESTHTASFHRDTEGAMRDTFLVDVVKMNGEPFKGTIPRTEALKYIFVKALGFSPDEFHGATPGFKGNPTILFKTKEVFNIDERLAGKSHFIYQKKVKTEKGEKVVEMSCNIRGIREKDPTIPVGPSYTWVKIEGAEYHLKEEQLRMWLSEYGFLVSNITEDREDHGQDSSEDEEIYKDVDLNTGIYSVKMNLNRQIPQLIPMCSKKIKIYHKGIKKQCMNCFETGHFKRNCKTERKEWLDYVDKFMLESKLPEEYYGKWSKLVKDWRMRNQQKHWANEASQDEKDERLERAKSESAENVEEIGRILRAQKLSSKGPKISEQDENEASRVREKTGTLSSMKTRSAKEKTRKEKVISASGLDSESHQDETQVVEVTRKKQENQTLKKSAGRGTGKEKGGLQSLQGSPTTTPHNKKQDE